MFDHVPDPRPDFIVTSQFTHHLADADIVRFLRWLERHAARGWFIVDLHRAAFAYWGFGLLATVARWHPIVRSDGMVSVARSFRRADWQRLLAEAGVSAEIAWHLGFRWSVGRLQMIRPNRPQTTAAVAAHYDELDPFYREVWGEHVHHGYWATGRESPDAGRRRAGRPRGRPARPRPGRSGVRHRLRLRRHRAAPGRAPRRRRDRCDRLRGPGRRRPPRGSPARRQPRPAAGDWLANGFPDGDFDRAYAIESSEHMEDKRRFFAEAWRTLRPGRPACRLRLARGRPIRARGRCATCSSRSAARAGCPAWAARATTDASPPRPGSRLSACEDLSGRVRRTWSICAARLAGKLVSEPSYRRFLLDARATDRVFALTVLRLLLAYRTGAMRGRTARSHAHGRRPRS